MERARAVYSGGANILRGGAYKPRTSPYSFQGLGEEGLSYLSQARAAIAAGADGIMLEVHNKPLEALSDGQQSLYPEEFVQLVKDIDKMAPAMGRRLFLHKSLLAQALL